MGTTLSRADILYRYGREEVWRRSPMKPVGNDRWRGEFLASEIGKYHYTVEGWIDRFGTWRNAMIKRIDSGQDIRMECLIGAELVEEAASRAAPDDAAQTSRLGPHLARSCATSGVRRVHTETQSSETTSRPSSSDIPIAASPRGTGRNCAVVVDREKAGFSAWYEMFPRSCAAEPGRHGTLRDCEARLPYVAAMGFDVLYLPPIHPIGHTARKGKNNEVAAGPDDVGSPWAIGSEEGGHTSIDPKLGTLEDFARLIAKAENARNRDRARSGFSVLARSSYVREHPEWFRKRPDGTIQYAENPPKKYQDIFPLDFETPQWRELWEELKRVVLFWIEHGVRIFRVDNPHTKALAFLGMDDRRG